MAWHHFALEHGSFVPARRPGPGLHEQRVGPGYCAPELSYLRRSALELTDSIVYSRRCIQPRWGPATDRTVVTKMDKPLITRSQTVNLKSCQQPDLGLCDPLPLHVPRPHPRRQYPHLVFGISSTDDRLRSALPGLRHWLSGTGARLVALVVDANPASAAADLAALEALYADHGIDLRALEPRNRTLTVAQNHFAVLGDLVDAATPATKWIVLVDDDTFIPSLYKLDQALRKHDPAQPAWLGALSEDFDSIRQWGFMAYGGAGVFLSMPLARQLVPHIAGCLVEAARVRVRTGDGILRDCIHVHTMTKLTIVPGLYQHDLYGDLGGFYESGVLPLSVHHWKSWYKEPLPKMAAITTFCGDCFLQRWQFGADTLFANGYSITQYNRSLDHYDLAQMEGTWSHAGREFDFSLGPLRTALAEGEKKSYRLKDAIVERNGDVRQIYVYKGDFFRDELDEVLELVWQGGSGIHTSLLSSQGSS